MKLEHFALNVANPVAMAKWYAEHMEMKIVRQQNEAPYTHFIADNSGRIMLEIYCNPADQVPAYHSMNALIVHLAYVSTDPDADKERLLAAGASYDTEVRLDDGTLLIMMRDPWGVAIQLCKRAVPMLLDKEA